MHHVQAMPPHSGDTLMHRPFQVTVVRADQARVQVRAAGSLDASTVDRLTAVLETLLGWGRRHVRLDMSRVTVSDEGCLPALVRVHEMFLAEHGLLVITVPRPDLAALLKRRRLERALFIAEEPQEPWPEKHGEERFDGEASSVAGSYAETPKQHA
jgi:anti-anti-sigma regulatory factor